MFAFRSQFEPQIRIGEQSKIKECTDNWLKNTSSDESSEGGLRGEGDAPGWGSTDPTDPNVPGAVGDSLALLLLFGASYGFFVKHKNVIIKLR